MKFTVTKFLSCALMLPLLIGCGSGGGDKNTPVIEPQPINQAPVVTNDVATIFKGEQINIDVLANDTDAENAQLTITAVTAIKGGVPEIINNKVTFVAEEDFTGNAQFSYTISDGSKTSQGLVNITIMLSAADKIVQLKMQVDGFIAQTIKTIKDENVNCIDNAEHEKCEPVLVKFSDGEFDETKADSNQTILIIDSGLEFPAVIRYRSRIKAAFKQKSDGFYQQAEVNSYDPQYEIPLYVKNTLQALDNFADENNQSTFIPANWLSSLHPEIEKLYSYADDYAQYVEHGKISLLYLLEHNPKASFVITPFLEFFESKKTLFCEPNEDNLISLKKHVSDIALQFKNEVMIAQNVKYINYSGGLTIENTVKTRWNKLCNKNLPSSDIQKALLDTVRPFYEVLFNTEGVFAFQASDINMAVDNNALDIDVNYKNRSLAADFSALDSQLPIDGTIEGIAPPMLLGSRDNSKHWIDVFVNFGIIDTRPFPYNDTALMDTNALGLRYSPISSLEPSWASPVALSWAINIKNSHFPDDALDNNIIEQIKDKMTPELCSYSNWDISDYYGKCKMQDPLLHRQHEVYRLGYLD